MKVKKFTYFFILFVSLFGLIASGELSFRDYTGALQCPKLFGIPACYIIFICFGLIFSSVFIRQTKLNYLLFWVGCSIALAIAGYGTAQEIWGHVRCPTTDGGLPKCFFSLGMFFSLAVAKVINRIRL